MVRNPNSLYAYWELSCETQSSVSSRFGAVKKEYQLILRVYDLTGLELDTSGCHSYFDVRLHPLADNYFINNVDSNRSYYVELGCYEPGGDFSGIMRSNLINTPRNGVSIGSDLCLYGLAVEEKGKDSLLIGSYANLGIYGESGHNAE